MYQINIEDTFDAAHFLANYDGPCNNMQGHTWKVKVAWEAHSLDDRDMVCDFKILKLALGFLVAQLDHKVINEELGVKQPTAEYIAKWFYDNLKTKTFKSTRHDALTLVTVTIIETPGNEVTYWSCNGS